LKLKGFQRQYLRSKAHHLKPKIQIGKNNINSGVINAINEAFNNNELIKIKLFSTQDKDDQISKITSQIDCSIVGDIGRILIAFKEFPEKQDRKIKLPYK
tara:strand:- start:545 stop:844 length:300 start_codon:yes stop_codon:yes gene_type:complete